jgi:hypothetical protein
LRSSAPNAAIWTVTLSGPPSAIARSTSARAASSGACAASVDAISVDVDAFGDAHRAGQLVPARVVRRFLGREHAAAHEFAHERVILGQLLQLTVPQAVGAAVADPAQVGALGGKEQGHAGRTHSFEGRVGVRALVDRPVREIEASAQPFLDGAVLAAEEVRQPIDQDPAGSGSTLRSAHAVGQDEQPPARPVLEVAEEVLVLGTGAADVAQRRRDQVRDVDVCRQGCTAPAGGPTDPHLP